ncbi:uncharacterized protein [Syngnathus scovelli]|uniref:uncharacterized protein n=1 Tax=Syngnathus scovelli TaxID=161590 RepID=UPI0035CC1958
MDSWKFTKPGNCPKNASFNYSAAYTSVNINQQYGGEASYKFNEGRIIYKNGYSSQEQDYDMDDWDYEKDFDSNKVIFIAPKMKSKLMPIQHCKEMQDCSLWKNGSWRMLRNNSKSCKKLREILPPEKEIYQPKANIPHLRFLLKQLQNNKAHPTEWKESLKVVKHKIGMDNGRMRRDMSSLFGDSLIKPVGLEWKSSWKLQCLCQEPEMWKQAWLSTPQLRVPPLRAQNYSVPVPPTKNGPTAAQNWLDSWRSSRQRHYPQTGHGHAQTIRSRATETSYRPADLHTRRKKVNSDSDWQAAWMLSETQFHHNTPSLNEWLEAWRFHTLYRPEQYPHEKASSGFMELQPQREIGSSQEAEAKFCLFFKAHNVGGMAMKIWTAAWKAGPYLNHASEKNRAASVPNVYEF